MHILITGGTGFIGTHLARRLAKNPEHSIVLLDNLYRCSEERTGAAESGAEFVRGDIRDLELITELVGKAEVVCHLAAQANVVGAVQDLDYSFSTNVVGTYNVLRAAERSGGKKVIFASSREVYGEKQRFPVSEDAALEPKNAYGVSKMAGEAYCRIFRSAGLPVTIFRLANVYGPGDRGRVIPIFVERALRGEPLVLYGGDQLVDFVWINTVVDAFERAIHMDALEGPVNIGSGTGVTVRELANIVIRETQSSSAISEAPSRSFETRGYVAAVESAAALGLAAATAQPLAHLDSVIRDCRARQVEAGAVLANS